MKGKVKCTCGWSWDKSDSSKKDMYICHECGRDNSNNMKNGGWLDNYGTQENYNDSQASAPEGMVGDGFSNVGRNYSPAWGGQFEDGGEIPIAQGGRATSADSLAVYNDVMRTKKYYETHNTKYFQKPKISPSWWADKSHMSRVQKDHLEHSSVTPANKQKIRQNKNPNQYLLSDMITGAIDKNAPLFRYDSRITPQGTITYTPKSYLSPVLQKLDPNFDKLSTEEKDAIMSMLGGYNNIMTPAHNKIYRKWKGKHPHDLKKLQDLYKLDRDVSDHAPGYITTLPYYDPLAVKPRSLRTPEEQREWQKKYGPNKTKDKPNDITPIQRPKLEAVQSLNPQAVNSDFDVTAQLPVIRPEAKLPKSFDVNSQRQTMSGPSEYYDYSGEGVDISDAVRAKQSADAYNQYVQEKYKEAAKSNPKAQKRLEQLMQKVELTPNYQMGGSVYPVNYVPQAQDGELTFLQPNSEKLPQGYRIPYADPSSELAMSIGGENGEPAYLIPSFKYGKPLYDPIEEFRRTGEHLGGPFKTHQEADEWERTVRHPYVEKGQAIPTPIKTWGEMAMGGSIPGAVGFTYARTNDPAPSEGPYAKKTMPSAQTGTQAPLNNKKALKILADIQNRKNKPTIPIKIKDERGLVTKPAESTGVKKRNFELEQAREAKSYYNAVAAQKKEAARRAKLTKEQREREDYNAYNQEHGTITKSVPETTWERTKAIVSNPMTAIGYKVRGENLPGRFQYGPRNPHDYAVDWINPLQGAVALSEIPGELSRGEFLEAGLSGLDALDLGVYVRGAKKAAAPLFQKGVKQLGNLKTTANPVLGGTIPATNSIKGKLKKGIEKIQKTNTYKAIDEHMSGLEQGLFYDKRPFFEKFPITKAQKAKVYAAQDQALEEGKQFIKDWHYGDDIDLHPDIVDKIKELDPNFKLSIYDNTNITNTMGPYANPFATTKDALVSTRRNILKNENISDEAKDWMLKERNTFSGVNIGSTNESLTSRNRGLYHYSPSAIKDTVIHEAGHTSEGLGTISHWDANGNIVWGSKPFDNIRTYDPDFTGYSMANPNTEQGKLFQEAMIEPTPHVKDADGNITKEGYTWAASPGELHSELLPARSNLIDSYVAQGYDRKEVMDMLRADASDAQIDWMIKNKNLNRFFKKTTSPELKRKVIRMLYAGVPAAVGLDALTNPTSEGVPSGMKQGGVIKDDRGQWDHPGEITEINSNDITMEGVPYPVLGISDTGDTKLMKPGGKYKYKGKKVTEFPMAKNGLRQEQKGLQNLDNLLNFTNYNKPQPGGWLNKYN